MKKRLLASGLALALAFQAAPLVGYADDLEPAPPEISSQSETADTFEVVEDEQEQVAEEGSEKTSEATSEQPSEEILGEASDTTPEQPLEQNPEEAFPPEQVPPDPDEVSELPPEQEEQNQNAARMAPVAEVLNDEPQLVDGAYQIGTAEELKWFRNQINNGTLLDAAVVLTADIDLNDEAWTPISNSAMIASQYMGVFDGDGHSIRNINVSGTTNVGFFGAVNNATIKNLVVEGTVAGTGNYVGGIVGKIQSSIIENCSFEGSVSTKGYVGGIAGFINSTGSAITSCANMAAVSGTYAGGILGYTSAKNTIENCYNSGTVTGSNRAGGIVGQANGFITSCFNIGEISGNTANLGGIYGFSAAEVTNCYHLYPQTEIHTNYAGKSVKIESSAGLIEKLDSSAFVVSSTQNNGYPILSWQTTESTEGPALSVSIRGEKTLYVQSGAGENEATLTLNIKNSDAEAEYVEWDVQTAKGHAAPEDIVTWQTATNDENSLILSAKQGGVISVTAYVKIDGELFNLTHEVTVVPYITTATIKNVNPLGTVAIGQPLEVVVNVSGGGEYDYENFPPLSYQWRYKTANPSANIAGATERTYTVPTNAGYSEWDYLYVEITSGDAVVKEAADVRGQLRSADYGTLYPVAYDEAFTLPTELKNNSKLTLPTTHTVGGVTAAVTWESEHSAIDANGNITLPSSGTVSGKLRARFTYGEAFANREFPILVYSAEAASNPENQSYLQQAAESLGDWYGPISPVYGQDNNIVTMLKSVLAAKGFSDLSVAVKSVTELHDGATIAENGDISYFYADPNGSRGLWFAQYRVAFTLSKEADSLDIEDIAVNLYWDKQKVEDALQNEILNGITEDIMLHENASANAVTTSLVLPKVVDNKKWALIEWTSSDPSAILVSNENQSTADTLFNPYVGKILRGNQDKEVILTAKINFQRTVGDDEIALYKTFKCTVPALAGTEADAIRAELMNKLDTGFKAAGLKDYVTGETLIEQDGVYTVCNDIRFPTTRDFKVDGKYFPVTITTSDNAVLVAPEVSNAARTVVYRPAVGEAAKTVEVSVAITDLVRGVTASKTFVMKVLPLTQAEINDAVALMDHAKTAYFTGLNDGRYSDDFSVSGGLHSFQEVVWNEDKSGVDFIYHVDNTTRGGIIADELDNWAEQEAWRAFRSSDAEILDHETLNLVAKPAEDTFVRIESVLTHEVLGKYANKEGYTGFEAFYKQPVSAYVMVEGVHHPVRSHAELVQLRSEAIAKINKPISAQFSLLGTRTQPAVQMRMMSTQPVAVKIPVSDEVLIQTTVDSLDAGTTVFGLFRKVMAEQGYTYKSVGSYVKSVTDANGHTLAERDGGPNSGWIYTVNGKIPSIYMNGYSLKENDEVVVRFTNDYTKESDFQGGGGSGSESGGGSGNNGGGSSNGGSRSGSSGGAIKNFLMSFMASHTGVVGNSMNTNAATASQITTALAGIATHGGVRLVNVTSISPESAKMVTASASGKQIFADTVINKAIVARMYLDAEAVSKLAHPIDTRIDTTAAGTAPVSNTFTKFFSNRMAFVQLGHTGDFGTSVSIAVKLDISGMNPSTLMAYSYDVTTNTCTLLAAPYLDTNGYIHIKTQKGGAIIITDKALTLK